MLKGDPMARNAVALCRDQYFRLYPDRRRATKFGVDIQDNPHTEEDARECVLPACSTESRAKLDHTLEASTAYRQIGHHATRGCTSRFTCADLLICAWRSSYSVCRFNQKRSLVPK